MHKNPSYFAFNITERCQSHCITCNGWKTPYENIKNELSANDWKFILFKMKEWLGSFDFIFSGGEPFLREDIFDIADYAKEIGLIPKVITNGLGLKNKCEKLIKSGFYDITISLNAVKNPFIHNKSRGRKDAFKITSDVIQNLAYLNRKYNFNKNILLSSVIMPSNLSELVPLAEFAKQNQIGINFQLMDDGNSFFLAYNIAAECNKSFDEIKDETVNAIEELKLLKQKGYLIYNTENQLDSFKDLIIKSEPSHNNSEIIQNVFDRENFNYSESVLTDKINQEYIESKKSDNNFLNCDDTSCNGCQIGYRNFILDPYGNVRICFNFESIGSLTEDLPQNLWNSQKASEIRRRISDCNKSCKLLNCNYCED